MSGKPKLLSIVIERRASHTSDMTAALPTNVGCFLALSGKSGTPIGGLYEVHGLPARKFKKELIRVGNFVHPTKGFNFDVDIAAIDAWVDTFAAMTADGEEITLAASHANTVDESRGYVRDLFREGESLYGIIECIGQDSLNAAARSNTSIYAESEFKSGSGKIYPWAIQHVALTTKPVIPGLKPFEALAASRDGKRETVVLALAVGNETMAEIDPNAAPDINPKDAVRKSFKSMAMKIWDDEALELPAFLAKTKELRRKLIDVLAKLGDDEPAEEEAPTADAVPAGAEIAEPIAASRDTSPNPDIVNLMADNRRGKLALAVQSGAITPAASKELETMFIGDKNSAIELSLSRELPDTFEATLNVVKAQGAGVSGAEKSGGQTLELGNPANKPETENPLVANAKKRKAAAEARSKK